MQMMNVLKPIAFDVVICMSQLFDYYLFAVSITFICYEQDLYRILLGIKITLRQLPNDLRKIQSNVIHFSLFLLILIFCVCDVMLLLIRSRIVSKRQVIYSFAVLICTLPKKLIIQISEFKIKTSGVSQGRK